MPKISNENYMKKFRDTFKIDQYTLPNFLNTCVFFRVIADKYEVINIGQPHIKFTFNQKKTLSNPTENSIDYVKVYGGWSSYNAQIITCRDYDILYDLLTLGYKLSDSSKAIMPNFKKRDVNLIIKWIKKMVIHILKFF